MEAALPVDDELEISNPVFKDVSDFSFLSDLLTLRLTLSAASSNLQNGEMRFVIDRARCISLFSFVANLISSSVYPS